MFSWQAPYQLRYFPTLHGSNWCAWNRRHPRSSAKSGLRAPFSICNKKMRTRKVLWLINIIQESIWRGFHLSPSAACKPAPTLQANRKASRETSHISHSVPCCLSVRGKRFIFSIYEGDAKAKPVSSKSHLRLFPSNRGARQQQPSPEHSRESECQSLAVSH